MLLTKRQGYIIAFRFLDRCWNFIQTDDFGKLLGAMNPNLFKEGFSADPAYWEDWLRCSKQVTDLENVTPEQVFKIMILFLEFYQNNFCFELRPVFDYLDLNNHLQDNWELKVNWITSIDETIINGNRAVTIGCPHQNID